jgi:hypothetical protein
LNGCFALRSGSVVEPALPKVHSTWPKLLLSPGLTWSLPGREAFARFASTLILIPSCFMFWMIAANYYGAEIPSAAPMGTIGALLLLTNIACLIVLRREMLRIRRARARMFEVMQSRMSRSSLLLC